MGVLIIQLNVKLSFIRSPYHIVITRKSQVFLNFLKIRLIINGKTIYNLPKGRPTIIPINENNPKIVATDGYHFTKPLELVYHHIHTYHFKIVCIIDDFQMMAGFALLFVFFMLGFATGFLFFKLLSLFPILYFLFLYYINRKEFIQIRAT